ncbi:EamA family transporter [Haloarculaceae archaeon H-GB11]|nr:EamA family transporter [Haloarculaceae archaeon H-GB1-1]MEA5387159.1 EamA family transporter [Haloarculaceae archaeon H-GB11]
MTRYRNVVLFLLLAAVWGSAFTAIKAGLADIPPVLFAALRYDIAGVIMLGYAWYATEQFLPRTRKQIALVVVGATLLIAAYHALLFVGEQGTTSGAAAVIVSLNPVLTVGFTRLFFPNERLSTLGLVGIGLGLAGVAVLSQPDPTNLFGGNTMSEFLVFLASAAFALGSVLTRWIDADLPIETMEAWSMVGGAALMHVVSVLLGESMADAVWSPTAIVSLAYLALAASAAGFLIYFDLLDRLGPVEINLVSYAAPVVASITGVALLGDRVTAATAVGFFLIFTGFYLLKRAALRSEIRRVLDAR